MFCGNVSCCVDLDDGEGGCVALMLMCCIVHLQMVGKAGDQLIQLLEDLCPMSVAHHGCDHGSSNTVGQLNVSAPSSTHRVWYML